MEENLIEIVVEPRKIIRYIKEKDSITSKDLEEDFGYSNFNALWVLIELDKRGMIIRGDYKYIKEKETVRPLWHLTEEGKKIKKWPKKIIMVGRKFPIVSKAAMEIMNYVLESAKAMEIEDLDELIEILKSQSPKIMEVAKRAHLEVLKDFSPKELRKLAQEIKELKL